MRLTPLEVGVGSAVGRASGLRLPAPAAGARAGLEELVLQAVERGGRVAVMFSGGRDSSTILAVATRVARRSGADDPLPVTARYPGDDVADESEWQQLVLDHLRIHERVVLDVGPERRVLGALARAHLREHGLVWPQAVQTQSVFFDALAPGTTLLTGEGGDVVLEGHRGTPIHLLLSDWPSVGRRHLRSAADAAAPGWWFERAQRSRVASSMPWLTRTGARAVARDTAIARGPLRWDSATRGVLRMRANVVIDHNTAVGASHHGVDMVHPLTHPLFLSSLAREGGMRGFRGRTHVFRHLAADLLPDALLSRTSKAAFNASRWGEEERDFAAGWDGSGVPEEVVDVAALRRHWLGERPHPVTFTTLQAAWLASHGLPLAGPAHEETRQ